MNKYTKTAIIAIILIALSGCVEKERFISWDFGNPISSSDVEIITKSYYIISEYEYISELYTYSVSKETYRITETYNPKPNYQYIIIDIKFKNIGDKTINHGSWGFSMSDQNGNPIDRLHIISDDDKLSPNQKLYPGQKIDGQIIFEIPSNSIKNTLYYEDPDTGWIISWIIT